MIYLRYWTASGISGVRTGCWKIKKTLGQLYVDKSDFEQIYDVTGMHRQDRGRNVCAQLKSSWHHLEGRTRQHMHHKSGFIPSERGCRRDRALSDSPLNQTKIKLTYSTPGSSYLGKQTYLIVPRS